MQEGDSILLVEDNADDAFIVPRALRKAGLSNRLEVVDSGLEAMRYLSGEGRYADRVAYPMPALVLLSADLKGLSGLYVLRWMRSQPRLTQVRVVMLSDYPAPGQFPSERLGAAWVVKPAGFPELVRVFRYLRVFWLEAPLPGGEWEKAA